MSIRAHISDKTIYANLLKTFAAKPAFNFAGDDDYIEFPDDENINFFPEKFSIALYVKVNSNSNAGHIVGNYYPYVTGGFYIGVYSDGKVSLHFGNASTFAYHTSNKSINDNKMHCIIMTYESGEANLYIDGQLDSQKTLGITPTSGNTFRIGKMKDNGWHFVGFYGQVFAIKIFNYVLSFSEQKELSINPYNIPYYLLGADNSVTVTAGSFTVGKKYRIESIGTTDFTAIGATSNTVGEEFIATGAGSGTGTAKQVGETFSIVPESTGKTVWRDINGLKGIVSNAALYNIQPGQETFEQATFTGNGAILFAFAANDIIKGFWLENTSATAVTFSLGLSASTNELGDYSLSAGEKLYVDDTRVFDSGEQIYVNNWAGSGASVTLNAFMKLNN